MEIPVVTEFKPDASGKMQIWILLEKERESLHKISLLMIMSCSTDSQVIVDKIAAFKNHPLLLESLELKDLKINKNQLTLEELRRSIFRGSFSDRTVADYYMDKYILNNAKLYATELKNIESLETERHFIVYLSEHPDFPFPGYHIVFIEDYKHMLFMSLPVRIPTSTELQLVDFASKVFITKDITKYKFPRTHQVQWIPLFDSLSKKDIRFIQIIAQQHINTWQYVCTNCYKIAQAKSQSVLQHSLDITVQRNNAQCGFKECPTLTQYVDYIDDIIDVYDKLFAANPNYFLDGMPGVPPMLVVHKQSTYEIIVL